MIQYRGERGHKEHKGEMQSNRQGDVLSKGKKGERGDTHTQKMSFSSLDSRFSKRKVGMAKLRERER